MKRAWPLRSRFKARPGQPDNFDTLTPDSIRGFIDSVLGMIAAGGGAGDVHFACGWAASSS